MNELPLPGEAPTAPVWLARLAQHLATSRLAETPPEGLTLALLVLGTAILVLYSALLLVETVSGQLEARLIAALRQRDPLAMVAQIKRARAHNFAHRWAGRLRGAEAARSFWREALASALPRLVRARQGPLLGRLVARPSPRAFLDQAYLQSQRARHAETRELVLDHRLRLALAEGDAAEVVRNAAVRWPEVLEGDGVPGFAALAAAADPALVAALPEPLRRAAAAPAAGTVGAAPAPALGTPDPTPDPVDPTPDPVDPTAATVDPTAGSVPARMAAAQSARLEQRRARLEQRRARLEQRRAGAQAAQILADHVPAASAPEALAALKAAERAFQSLQIRAEGGADPTPGAAADAPADLDEDALEGALKRAQLKRRAALLDLLDHANAVIEGPHEQLSDAWETLLAVLRNRMALGLLTPLVLVRLGMLMAAAEHVREHPDRPVPPLLRLDLARPSAADAAATDRRDTRAAAMAAVAPA